MDSVKNGPPPTGTASRPAADDAASEPRTEAQGDGQAFMAFVRAKERASATMSPAERAAAEASWEDVIDNINDARSGHRKVFVE